MIFQLDSDVLITTSRKPSQKTRRFSQFLKHYFNFKYINRGKSSFNKVVTQTRQEDVSKLIVITETKGNPSSINVYDIEKSSEEPLYSIYINCSLPSNNSKINTKSNDIYVINKAKSLSEFNKFFMQIKPSEKIKTNCVICRDYDKDDSVASGNFIDKNGDDTKFKIYISGFKINE